MTAHPFADLQPSDRADWITGFFSRRSPRPPEGLPPYPSLVAAQTPGDWLVDKYQRMVGDSERRDNVRESIVRLIDLQGGTLQHPDDRDQVLGLLLSVARDIDLRQVAPTLAGWVRSGWLDQNHAFDLGSERVPLRRIVWSMLIGWREASQLGPQLTRDLRLLAESREAGTAQICFKALGEIDPAEAIRVIPVTVWWPASYWLRTVRRFLESVGPVELLSVRYEEAWKACLGPCFFDPRRAERLREPDRGRLDEFDGVRENRLWRVLGDVGIALELEGDSIRLSIAEGLSLDVDVGDFRNMVEEAITGMPLAGQTVFELAAG